MSVLGPMYDIPNTIRLGIEILTSWNNKERIENGIEDIRSLFNEYASKLNQEEVEEVMVYLLTIIRCLNGIINGFSSIGIELEKEKKESEEREVIEKEDTGVQEFVRHIFADQQSSLINQICTISSALKVVNIAKEEIGKYVKEVCVCDSADGVVLRKVVGNIDE